MGAENFVNASVAGKRQGKRARVLLAARIQSPLGDLDVRLRDLSQKGALIECAETLPTGTEVTFVRNSTVIPARVAWSAANRMGLEFHCMIDEHEVLVQLRKTSNEVPQQRFRRPRLHGDDMTDHERKLVRVWGMAVGIAVPHD